MKTHMGSGLRPMIIMSSTSISRSQPAFALEERPAIGTDYFKCSMIYIYLNKIFIVIIINNSNIFKLNTMPIKGGQIHLYKKAFPCSFHLSGTEE